jgi:uncharacterized membrane protein
VADMEQATPRTSADTGASAHRLGLGCLIALMALCLLWEWLLAPIRPGGSWLILKALPLIWPTWIIWRRPHQRRYVYQLSTMLIWFYFTEGIVRAWSDLNALSQFLAGLEAAICCVFFIAAVRFVRNSRAMPNAPSSPDASGAP